MNPKQVDFLVKRTPTFIQALETLNPEQAQIFEDLVGDYQYAAFVVHGWKISSPKVLAELVRLGWKKG